MLILKNRVIIAFIDSKLMYMKILGPCNVYGGVINAYMVLNYYIPSGKEYIN